VIKFGINSKEALVKAARGDDDHDEIDSMVKSRLEEKLTKGKAADKKKGASLAFSRI
jgi:hypothetical protein